MLSRPRCPQAVSFDQGAIRMSRPRCPQAAPLSRPGCPQAASFDQGAIRMKLARFLALDFPPNAIFPPLSP